MNKLFSTLFTIVFLVSCGGGSDTSIASPGQLGQVDPPTGGSGGGATTSNTRTGTCPSHSNVSEDSAIDGNTVCAISGEITDELTLTDDVIYRLFGTVNVGIDMGGDGQKAGGAAGILNIPADAIIISKTSDDYLIVNRGSKIEAKGTSTKPIVFTHSSAFDGSLANPETATGLWGGIVILGKAPINKCSNDLRGTADCEKLVEGATNALMGGATPDDNSGTLRFVRVEYAGYEVFPGNELNGITFGAVGSGTTVDYVQVHNNADDCVEFFGGTVNVKHLVCTNAGDDNIDVDWGYTGKLQYVVIKQASGSGDHIVESDNTDADPNVGWLTTPRSTPKVANFTFISSGQDEILKFKEGVSGIYMNGVIVSNGSKGCVEHTKAETLQDAPGFDKLAHHSIFMDCGSGAVFNAGDDSATAAELEASILERATNISIGTNSLVGTYFLGENESNVVSAFNNQEEVCSVGTHASGSTSVLCPDNATQIDSFFAKTNYIGAFGPGSDVENNWAAGWTKGLFSEAECPEGTVQTETLLGSNVCTVSGTVTSDLTLTYGNLYRLEGKVQVGNDMGSNGTKDGGIAATLTIEPGVTIFGESGSDYLVIMRGSQIVANGTSSAPIIMTARDDITGQTDQYSRGLWGGLVILGQAPINKCTFTTAGTATTAGTRVDPCEKLVEGATDALMGGEDKNDNSGSLKYLRVQYAGYEIFPGNELNGITFGAVGDATVVDYVQVHNNADDCVEFFGGTVNVKHLICTGAGDDNLDIDWGYQGKMQFVIVQQAEDTGDHIVESDNTDADAGVGYLTEPRSNPIISNFTFISKGHDDVVKLKEGVAGVYTNGIVFDKNNAKACLEHTKAETFQDGALTPKVSFNSVAFDCSKLGAAGDSSGTDAQVAALATAGSNNLYSADSGGGTYTVTLTGVVNGSNENAATVTSKAGDTFFTEVDYIGAVKNSSDTWYKNWTVPGSIELD